MRMAINPEYAPEIISELLRKAEQLMERIYPGRRIGDPEDIGERLDRLYADFDPYTYDDAGRTPDMTWNMLIYEPLQVVDDLFQMIAELES